MKLREYAQLVSKNIFSACDERDVIYVKSVFKSCDETLKENKLSKKSKIRFWGFVNEYFSLGRSTNFLCEAQSNDSLHNLIKYIETQIKARST
ncbi:MAG: hypothetical protein H8E32_14800 [Nitrospinae bacterium]|nr:hypothetical protein [Nitrospinota bacterium]